MIRCVCGSRSNLSANHRTPKIENGRKTEREKENRSDVRVRPSVRPSLVWPELHGAEEREDTAGQTGRQTKERKHTDETTRGGTVISTVDNNHCLTQICMKQGIRVFKFESLSDILALTVKMPLDPPTLDKMN